TLARGRVDAVDAIVAMDQAGSIGVLDEPRVGSMANVVTLRRADARLALRIDGWPGTVNAEDSIVLKLRRARDDRADVAQPWVESTREIRIDAGVGALDVSLLKGAYYASATGRNRHWGGREMHLESASA